MGSLPTRLVLGLQVHDAQYSEHAGETVSLECELTHLWNVLGVLHPRLQHYPHIAVHGTNACQHVCICPTEA